MIDLKGQTALVTGASRGLGYAIAMRLARQGAAVHLVARNLEAVQEAARYGLYDLDRLERMILRRVAREYFLLKDGKESDD